MRGFFAPLRRTTSVGGTAPLEMTASVGWAASVVGIASMGGTESVGCNPMVDDEAVEHGAPEVGTGVGTEVGTGVGVGISVMGASSPSWWS